MLNIPDRFKIRQGGEQGKTFVDFGKTDNMVREKPDNDS
jgi:hypothetical protein